MTMAAKAPAMDAATLAKRVKAWRGQVPALRAAEILGLSRRTLEGIEQGRGFRYPQLLDLAMRACEARLPGRLSHYPQE